MVAPRTLVLSGLLAALLLSGCTGGNSVTVAGQGYKSGSETKTLDCGDTARLAIGAQGAGRLSITVKDGSGATVYSESNVGAGQDGSSEALRGKEGTWSLRVDTGFGYSGQYGIALSC